MLRTAIVTSKVFAKPEMAIDIVENSSGEIYLPMIEGGDIVENSSGEIYLPMIEGGAIVLSDSGAFKRTVHLEREEDMNGKCFASIKDGAANNAEAIVCCPKGDDTKLVVYSANDGTPYGEFPQVHKTIHALETYVSGDGMTYLLSADAIAVIRVWNITTREVIRELRLTPEEQADKAVDKDILLLKLPPRNDHKGPQLLYVIYEEKVSVWDLDNGVFKHDLILTEKDLEPASPAQSDNEPDLVGEDKPSASKIDSSPSEDEDKEKDGDLTIPIEIADPFSVVMLPGHRLACWYTNGFLAVHDTVTGEMLKAWKAPVKDFSDSLAKLLLHPTGKFLVAASGCSFKLWNLETYEVSRSITPVIGGLISIVFFKDKLFASIQTSESASQTSIIMWDLSRTKLNTNELEEFALDPFPIKGLIPVLYNVNDEVLIVASILKDTAEKYDTNLSLSLETIMLIGH